MSGSEKERIQLKRRRFCIPNATCEGFWGRVIEDLLPNTERGRRLNAQIVLAMWGSVGVPVFKKKNICDVKFALFELRQLKPGFHMAELKPAWPKKHPEIFSSSGSFWHLHCHHHPVVVHTVIIYQLNDVSSKNIVRWRRCQFFNPIWSYQSRIGPCCLLKVTDKSSVLMD